MNSPEDKSKQNSLFPDIEKPVAQPERQAPKKRKSPNRTIQPPQSTLEIALRLKLKEMKLRYRNLLYVGLAGALFFGMIMAFAVNSFYQSKSNIENNYKEIEELITAAYRADPAAHAEVVERFPILTKGRLPKKLKRLQSNPVVTQKISDNANLSSPPITEYSEIDTATNAAAALPVKTLPPLMPKPKLDVYAQRLDKKLLLGRVFEESAFTVVERNDDWTSVFLNTGLPVWISASYVEETGGSEVTVSASRVGLRSLPSPDKTLIVLVVDTNDTLEVLQKQDGWYRVNSPTGITAWIKNDELDRFLTLHRDYLDQLAARQSMQQLPEIKTSLPNRQSEFESAIEFSEISTPLTSLKLYSGQSQQSIVLGSIRDDSEIISIRRRGEWSSIMLSNGIPVWVAGTDVKELSSSLVEVTSQQVGLRIRPIAGNRYIVGFVNKGDKLQVLDKEAVWYQVNTPADFQAWVKTVELDSLIEQAQD